MGIHTSKSYQINNSAIGAPKSKKKRKSMNSPNKFLQHIGCSKIVKRRGNGNPELIKSLSCVLPNEDCKSDVSRYSLGHYEVLAESSDAKTEARRNGETDKNCLDVVNCVEKKQVGECSLDNAEPITKDLTDNNSDFLKCNVKYTQGRSLSTPYPRLSETSLDSEDLMLSTDVNLDQADDDVSKDYNGSEKDDPFISALQINSNPEGEDNISVQMRVEDSEKNDIVYFDSSRESSSSLQRKMGSYRVNCRRPHSFSTPLRTDNKSKVRRSSNLTDSVDLSWTWLSASESANVCQEISNIKLMLLKTKRLLLDDLKSEDLLNNFSPLNENDPSVFSEPSTPIYCNTHGRISNLEPELPSYKDWSNMDKEALIQELLESYNRNKNLQSQLNDKNRVIELLQDSKRRFLRSNNRMESGVSRISRSSTFDSSAIMNHLSPTQDSPSATVMSSKDSKKSKPGLKNIDSGLYQSSSSTESNLYQN